MIFKFLNAYESTILNLKWCTDSYFLDLLSVPGLGSWTSFYLEEECTTWFGVWFGMWPPIILIFIIRTFSITYQIGSLIVTTDAGNANFPHDCVFEVWSGMWTRMWLGFGPSVIILVLIHPLLYLFLCQCLHFDVKICFLELWSLLPLNYFPQPHFGSIERPHSGNSELELVSFILGGEVDRFHKDCRSPMWRSRFRFVAIIGAGRHQGNQSKHQKTLHLGMVLSSLMSHVYLVLLLYKTRRLFHTCSFSEHLDCEGVSHCFR